MFFRNRPASPAANGPRLPAELEFVVFGSRVSDSCFTGG